MCLVIGIQYVRLELNLGFEDNNTYYKTLSHIIHLQNRIAEILVKQNLAKSFIGFSSTK